MFIIHLLQSSSDEADINVNAFIYHTSVTEFFRWSWHQCQCLYLSYICYRVLQMKLTSNVNCHFLSYICYRVLQMKLTSMSMPLFIIHLLQSSSDEADMKLNQCQCLYLSYICYRVLQMKLTSMSMPLFIIHLLQSSSDEADINVNAFIYHTSVTEFFRWSWHQCQYLYLSYICYRVLQMKLTSMSMPLFIIHLLQSSSDEADINVNAFIYHTSVTEFFRWSWHQCQCHYLSYICYRVLQMKLTSMSMPLFIIHLLQSSSDEADINVNAFIYHTLLQSSSDEADINVNAFIYHTSVTEFFRWSWHQCQCLYLSYICYRVLQMKLTSMSMPLFIIHLLQSSSDEADINVNAFIYHTSVTEFFRWSWHQCQCLYLSYICYRVLQMKLTSMSMPLFIIHLLQSSSDEADINVNAFIYHTSVTEFFRWSWHQCQCLYLSYICYRVLQMKLTVQ